MTLIIFVKVILSKYRQNMNVLNKIISLSIPNISINIHTNITNFNVIILKKNPLYFNCKLF